MNCMKCGREIALGQVFCKECLADMANYPVPPGTPVVLPHFDTATPRRSASRKVKKPEEQITQLRKLVIGLSLLALTLALAFAVTTSVLLSKLKDPSQNRQPGQNYSTEAIDHSSSVSRETLWP